MFVNQPNQARVFRLKLISQVRLFEQGSHLSQNEATECGLHGGIYPDSMPMVQAAVGHTGLVAQAAAVSGSPVQAIGPASVRLAPAMVSHQWREYFF